MKTSITTEAMNRAFLRALRDKKLVPPSLERITLLELLAPEQQAITAAKARRKRLAGSTNVSWVTKLTRKLDRLVFPETTQHNFKITEAHQIGRMLRNMSQRMDKSVLTQLRTESLFGMKLRDKLESALWRFDGTFFINLGRALNTPPSPRALLYAFLIRQHEQISRTPTVAQILAIIPDNLQIDRGSFYSLCREIGLPAVEKG